MLTEINGRTVQFTAEASDCGKTCGDFLRSKGVSRRLLVKLKRMPSGMTRDGETVRTVDPVRNGDVIVLRLEDESLLEPNFTLNVPVAYEDSDVIVFNKPAGMPVHPSVRHQGDTLGNCFAAMFPQTTFRPVNRLDKDTSGLCAVAKNAHAANLLSGSISKIYMAVTEGTPIPHDTGNPLFKWYENGSGIYTIDAPIGRSGGSIIRREISINGQRAVTDYTIIKENGRHSLVKVSLKTGRTHQIRVHFSSAGHPLAGDDFYGGSLEFCETQALHCGEMSFSRPSDGKIMTLFCPIREDMEQLIK